HLVPDEAHGGVEDLAPLVPGDVSSGRGAHHGVDTRQTLGGSRVDGADTGVRVRTAQHLRVELTWQPHIVGVARGTGDLLAALEARVTPAGDGKGGVGRPALHIGLLDHLDGGFLAAALSFHADAAHDAPPVAAPWSATRRPALRMLR